MPFGINDLKNVIRIPINWDLAYLRQFTTADGVTWDRVVSRLGAGLAAFNGSLRQGPWASFFRVTTDFTVEYGVGGTDDELPPMPEHNRPDLVAGEQSGHMIPMRDYGIGLGWTSLALRRATASNMEADVIEIIQRGENTYRKRMMERLFWNTTQRVGTGGISLPFADAGVGDDTYVPMSFDGVPFDATHNHYHRFADDEAGRTAALNQHVADLREHGHMPPYTLVVPEADAGVWAAQPEFVRPERAILLTAGLELRAQVPDTNLYTGVFEVDRGWGYVMPTNRIPANYSGMFKLYGHGNARSPLVIRHERGYPLGLSIEGQVVIYPLQEAVTMMTFGVGVNDRTNGSLVLYAASGDYVNPPIT